MYVPPLFFVVLCSFAGVSTLGGGREGPVYSCTCTAIQSVFQPRIGHWEAQSAASVLLHSGLKTHGTSALKWFETQTLSLLLSCANFRDGRTLLRPLPFTVSFIHFGGVLAPGESRGSSAGPAQTCAHLRRSAAPSTIPEDCVWTGLRASCRQQKFKQAGKKESVFNLWLLRPLPFLPRVDC